MRIRLIVFGLLMGLSYCGNRHKEDEKELIDKKIKSFLTWYSKNWKTLAVDLINPIIENSMLDAPDSTKPYKINFKASEHYLDAFQKAGFVSEIYLNSFREYFKKCQENFESEPQTSGPASGFEYDFIFRSQDYNYQKENPDKAIITDILINGDKAKATVKFDDTNIYAYSLSKIGTDWFIDGIKAKWEE